MNFLRGLWAWIRGEVSDPFDYEFTHSAPMFDEFECPDTQPTSPGALDSDPDRLN